MSGPSVPPPDGPAPDAEASATPDTVDSTPAGATSIPTAPRPSSEPRSGEVDGARVGGVLLIGLGLFFLLGQRVPDLGQYVVLGVGLFLFALFLVYRDYGLLVPACIVSGVGAGIPIAATYEGDLGGGAFLISLGCGFLAIWILGLLFRLRDNHPWPLVPGVILGTLGATTAARAQGQDAVNVVETVWPIVVIVAGVLLMVTTLAERRRS